MSDEADKKLRRKNLVVGVCIAVIAVLFYLIAILRMNGF